MYTDWYASMDRSIATGLKVTSGTAVLSMAGTGLMLILNVAVPVITVIIGLVGSIVGAVCTIAIGRYKLQIDKRKADLDFAVYRAKLAQESGLDIPQLRETPDPDA